MTAPSLTRSDQLTQLRDSWSQDEETRLDLSTFGYDLVQALYGGSTHERRPSRSEIERFRSLAQLTPEALTVAPSMSAHEAETLRLFLVSHGSSVLHSARRRWAQSLSLAGAFDFGGESNTFELAFSQATHIGAQWYLSSHPDFKRHDENSLTRPLAEAIHDAKRGCAQVFMQSLLCLGRDFQVDSFTNKIIDALSIMAKSNKPHRFERGYLHDPESLSDRLRSSVESAWIAEGARSKALCAPGKKPRI